MNVLMDTLLLFITILYSYLAIILFHECLFDKGKIKRKLLFLLAVLVLVFAGSLVPRSHRVQIINDCEIEGGEG